MSYSVSVMIMVYLILMFLSLVEAFVPLQRVFFERALVVLQTTASDDAMSELYRRIDNLAASEKLQQSLLTTDKRVMLPTISFDALLPNQRLEARTTDPTFSQFLAFIGIGGLFVMTSVNHSKRMLRRNGVVCKLEVVDAKQDNTSGRIPTAVDFVLRGQAHCRLVGPSINMKARVGRWRRAYDPDGEEPVLGWGEERFVDAFANATALSMNDIEKDSVIDDLPTTHWSLNEVECAIQDADSEDSALRERIETIIPLLKRWQTLASDVKTYENTDVVAAARVMKGQPGLGVDPAALIRNVLKDLGEMPPENPTEFAFWGAALMNPLPVLGVSPEIRGRVLEAPDALSRLKILEWGVQRSIRNLEGTDPL